MSAIPTLLKAALPSIPGVNQLPGVKNRAQAESLVVSGDWSFGEKVVVRGRAELDGDHGRVEAGSVIGDAPAD